MWYWRSRMLKRFTSIVLASFRSSTYPRGYASGLHSLRPCWTILLSILRDCHHLPMARAVEAHPPVASAVMGGERKDKARSAK
jgi:hypothetical protein